MPLDTITSGPGIDVYSSNPPLASFGPTLIDMKKPGAGFRYALANATYRPYVSPTCKVARLQKVLGEGSRAPSYPRESLTRHQPSACGCSCLTFGGSDRL